MKIAVDLDGVLYQWSPTARYLLNTHRGGSFHREPDAWHWIPNPEDDEWLFSKGVAKYGLFRYGAIYRGAIDGMNALREGRDLCLITHRPSIAVQDTIDWVRFFFPWLSSYLHLATNGEPKSTMCDVADILIDDKPENCEEWVGSGRTGAVLVRQPWNRLYMPSDESRIICTQGGWDTKKLYDHYPVGILWAIQELEATWTTK